MPKFKVTITKYVEETYEIEVDAADYSEAWDIGYECANEHEDPSGKPLELLSAICPDVDVKPEELAVMVEAA